MSSGGAAAGALGSAGGAAAGTAGQNAGGTTAVVDPYELKQDCGGIRKDEASPTTIEATVDLINSLPKPLSLPCFLSALKKPLKLNLTRSLISAQPSVGLRSPRVFVFFDRLIMSVVPEGDGSALLEFGQLDSETRSIKAEILFPVLAPVPRAAPFERVLFTEGIMTTCGVCHSGETRYDLIDYAPAYISKAIKPEPGYALPIANLHQELAICKDSVELDRCEMLRALLRGNPVEQQFPASMTTTF